MPFNPDLTLHAIVVNLIARDGGTLPATQGALAHAAFLDLVRAADPELGPPASSGGRQPFTISPLGRSARSSRAGSRACRRPANLAAPDLARPGPVSRLFKRLLAAGPDLCLRVGEMVFAVERFWARRAAIPGPGTRTAGALRPRGRSAPYPPALCQPHGHQPGRQGRGQTAHGPAALAAVRLRCPARRLEPADRRRDPHRVRELGSRLRGRARGAPLADQRLPVEARRPSRRRRRCHLRGAGRQPGLSAPPSTCSGQFAFYGGVGSKTTMGMGQAKRWGESDMELPDYLPLSYLNQLLYCERRFWYMYVQGELAVNAALLEGTLPTTAAAPARAGCRSAAEDGRVVQPRGRAAPDTAVRRVAVHSDRLRINGFCDLVEETGGVLRPVEYKRGKQGRWDNDQVQLCAQALCLEERLETTVPEGEIYYYRSRHRVTVPFTAELRRATERAAARAFALLAGDDAADPTPRSAPAAANAASSLSASRARCCNCGPSRCEPADHMAAVFTAGRRPAIQEVPGGRIECVCRRRAAGAALAWLASPSIGPGRGRTGRPGLPRARSRG